MAQWKTYPLPSVELCETKSCPFQPTKSHSTDTRQTAWYFTSLCVSYTTLREYYLLKLHSIGSGHCPAIKSVRLTSTLIIFGSNSHDCTFMKTPMGLRWHHAKEILENSAPATNRWVSTLALSFVLRAWCHDSSTIQALYLNLTHMSIFCVSITKTVFKSFEDLTDVLLYWKSSILIDFKWNRPSVPKSSKEAATYSDLGNDD